MDDNEKEVPEVAEEVEEVEVPAEKEPETE